MKFIPELDKDFKPMYEVLKKYGADVAANCHKEVKICVERNDGYNYIYSFDVYADGNRDGENERIAERLIKTILWVVGGYKIYVCGDRHIYEYIKEAYTDGGIRAFDKKFMERVYEKKFEVVSGDKDGFPAEKKCSLAVGGHLDGCRIGFD